MEPTQQPNPNPNPEPVNVTPVEPQQPQSFPAPLQPVSTAEPQATVPVPLEPAVTSATNPGQTLGIVSLITALLPLGLVGLVTAIISRKQSKAAGLKSSVFATIGLILSIVQIIGVTFVLLLVFLGSTQKHQEAITRCQNQPTGTLVTVDSSIFKCNDGDSVSLQ
jgi:hypothetical protein